jgi:hypothetical protein
VGARKVLGKGYCVEATRSIREDGVAHLRVEGELVVLDHHGLALAVLVVERTLAGKEHERHYADGPPVEETIQEGGAESK